MIKKYDVIVMKAKGHTYSEIEEETDFGRGTISTLIKKFEEHGDINCNLHNNARRP